MKKSDLKGFKASLLSPLPVSHQPHSFEFLLSYELNVSPEDIWPYIADTSRMNKELGFPPRVEEEVGGEMIVTTKTLGREEIWIEKPWVWVANQELQSHRLFKKGWMTEQRGVFKVLPTSNGCEVQVYFHWIFPNMFSKWFFSVAVNSFDKMFKDFFEKKERFIKNISRFSPAPVKMEVTSSPYETLLNYVKSADELDLDRIRIKKIAKETGVSQDSLLTAAKKMVDEGFMTVSWDIVCPHCRGVTVENKSVAAIKTLNSCEACDADFKIDAEESVEVVFHVTPKLRVIPNVVYCAAEPAKKKHIKLNQYVNPGESKTFHLQLEPGFYRARTRNQDQTIVFEVREDASEKKVEWATGNKKVSGPHVDFSFTNIADKPEILTIEEAWWKNESLSPGEVLSNPALRELLSKDHLQLGVKLNVGNQVIMFTDIVGSTPFYKASGDAKAFKAVQDHYLEVSDLIRKYDGVVVKYIGDAVMAAFLDIEKAFQCTIELHKKFPPERTDTPIKLRASIGSGSVLCANMNVGLDYFGNTVNQSAKIQKWANAFEVAVSAADWQKLQGSFPHIQPQNSVHDEKLDVDVKVIRVLT